MREQHIAVHVADTDRWYADTDPELVVCRYDDAGRLVPVVWASVAPGLWTRITYETEQVGSSYRRVSDADVLLVRYRFRSGRRGIRADSSTPGATWYRVPPMSGGGGGSNWYEIELPTWFGESGFVYGSVDSEEPGESVSLVYATSERSLAQVVNGRDWSLLWQWLHNRDELGRPRVLEGPGVRIRGGLRVPFPDASIEESSPDSIPLPDVVIESEPDDQRLNGVFRRIQDRMRDQQNGASDDVPIPDIVFTPSDDPAPSPDDEVVTYIPGGLLPDTDPADGYGPRPHDDIPTEAEATSSKGPWALAALAAWWLLT